MHIAIALNKKVMGIFGPSAIPVVNPTQYDQRNITIRSDMECIPCNNIQCKLPDDKKLSCLTGISTRMVWEQLQKVI
jgi:ADP-heptose:LPS heptosyltransferase